METTLRELLTPAEQQRFKNLYNQGYFNELSFQRYLQRVQTFVMPQLKNIDTSVQRAKDHWRQQGWTESQINNHPFIQGAEQRRRKVWDSAYRDPNIFSRGAIELETLGTALEGPWVKTFVEDVKKAGPLGVASDVGRSLVESVPRGLAATRKTFSEGLGDEPINRIGEMGGAIPVIGGLAGVGARLLGRSALKSVGRSVLAGAGGQELSEAAFRKIVQEAFEGGVGAGRARFGRGFSRIAEGTRYPGYVAETADILAAGEHVGYEALLEVLGEGVVEGGRFAGRSAVEDLKSGRMRKIFQGLDPQAASDAQTTESTTEHDTLTGSRTAPPGRDYAPQADSLVNQLIAADEAAQQRAYSEEQLRTDEDPAQAQLRKMAIASLDAETQRRRDAQAEREAQQAEADAQALAYSRAQMAQGQQAQAAESEAEALAAQQATTQQQAAEMAAEASAQRAAAEAEKIEFTRNYLAFYSDLAGGSQSEGIRLLNAEYEAGVRDPIAHRYDQIAAELQQQMGVAPSELHREADSRLRQQIGEKWYNIYRGIDQRPTPQQRAQRAADAAEKIVEGTDAESTEPTEPTPTDGTAQTGPDGAAQTDTAEQIPAAESPAEAIPQARIGRENTGYESDGTTGHRVRPVLRELDDLVPSHQTDGQKREDYPEDLQPREGRGGAISMEQVRNTARTPNFAFLLEFFKQFRDGAPVTSKKHPRRIVSGNGRTLALQIMRQDYPENWEGYQEALRAELEKVGIDPAEADAMEAPVLTYELVDDIDEVALAKDANVQATLDHTAAEQASQDAQYFDDDLMALWQPSEGNFEETLKSEDNQAFRTALFNRIPTHLVSAFMTADNKNFSNDGIQRIQNAMIRYVFGGQIGEQLSRIFIETGLEGVKNIEAMLRNAIASLAYAKANGQDISTDLASAIFRFLEINETAEREAQQRKQPKDVMLYAGIDALYKSGALIDAPTLLEKQLLYLIYAKRNAPRQLADDFQTWARSVVSMASTEASLFDVSTSTAIFAGMIRDYIRETIFETRPDADGRMVLLPPESMPPELVNLREDIDKISTTEGKTQAVNDWIDAFLRVMNEGETQDETSTDQQTAVSGRTPADTGTPRGTEQKTDEGGPDRTDTGTPATPESQGGVAPTQPRGTDGADVGGTQGDPDSVSTDDRGSDLSVEDALAIAFPGENITVSAWEGTSDRLKFRALQRAEREGVDAAAIRRLEQSISQQRGETDADTTTTETSETGGEVEVETGDPIDTNQVVGTSRRIETQDTPTVSPVLQRDLDTLGISVEEWERMKAAGEAITFINNLTPEQQEQVEWAVNLTADVAGEMPDAAMADEDLDFEDDEDIFSDVQPGILKDITDQQRSDFDNIRRKLFLARTINRLEAKGTDRTPVETASLRALTAPQRTDAQQEIYEQLLTMFIDQTVQRLQAKDSRSATENRILEALTTVRAEGIPEEASELSLYADLDTPDQAHSRPLAETRTLAGVQAPDTADTDLDLPETVKKDTTKLSPAQQTSVKAIISAFLRKIHTDTDTTVQGGFLLGDKPGVGKTRQALAAIWHYMRQGINKHFVLAPNQQILDNYSADMQAMGGPASDISHYDSSNPQPTTPIGTTTYAMLTRKPELTNFATPAGNQNAVADIIQHLTGVRPTLAVTHPEHHQATLEAYRQILSNVQTPTVENVVTELRRQAGTVNLDNAAHVENFRQRLTPLLADLLLAERTQEGQQEMFEGSLLEERVKQLLSFAQAHLAAQPDPNFAETASQFEGVIVLDEMHKAAGTNSQIGQMISKLHELLPNAKFLYMSATPFKEIDNFFIAERLGLWGANQPFNNFSQFRRAFRRAARAVKEVIPLHLKQIGRYISRALSSKETRYTPVEVPLTDTEKQQYDTAVQLVQGIRQRFESAIDAAERTPWGSIIENEGEFHQFRAKYMRMYYNTMQVFFLALLDAMKAQGLTENIQEKLQAGDKVIVQLENTWEKSIERARGRGRQDTETVGPFDLLIDFVENENTFPIHEHQTEVRTRRSDGSHYTVVVPRMVYNEDGQQVRSVDPNLKRLQTQLIEALRQEMQKSVFTAGLPFAADIIHTIALEAGATSGEISGRSEIYPRHNPTQMPQNTEARIARAEAFSNTTDLNLIVLGPAGLTGINLPVSESIKDDVGGLYHYLVQSSWNVNTFEQGLGRGKRSNSAIDPHYQVVHQDLPGADRVLGATLAKFAEMGALAGQADNALMQNIDKVEGETSLDDDPEADVFEETPEGERSHVFGVHGNEALGQLWKDMYDTGDMQIADLLGLPHPEEAGGTGFIDPDTIPSVQQFFQRLLHLSTEAQSRIYQEFESRLKRIISMRKDLKELDIGANNLDSQDGQITNRLTIYTDPDTGQTAEIVQLSVKRELQRRSWEFVQKVIRGEPGYEHYGHNFAGIYQDADGYVWAVFEAPFTRGGETEFIRWGPRGTPIQGIHQGENRLITDNLVHDMTLIAEPNQSLEQAQRLWEAEDNNADTYVDSEFFMATGLLLPKWQDLSIPNTPTTMAVIPMLDGSHLHGRVIPSGVLPEVLEQIGGVDPNYFSQRSPTETDSQQQQTPADADVDIPAIVRDIIGEQTDTRVAQRLEKIVEHIHKNLPLRLRGHRVRTAAEAALLGQLIRDPQVEHTWVVYRKDDRIVKIEPMSLSRKGETKAGDFTHIKREAGRLRADAILRIHNHPSGVAKWSQADKDAAMEWHKELGTLMAEDIIVDSGTYAYRTFENGQYTWHQDIELDPGAAEFDTSAAAVSDPSGEVKPTDPLYQNPLIRGAREAATYMLSIKHGTSRVAEMIFTDPKTGKIVDTITDVGIRNAQDPVSYLENAMTHHQSQHVHIALWGVLTHSETVSLAQSLQGVEGVDSVWVNAERVTGMEHIGDQAETDNRTQQQRETDAILNRTFERLTGQEQPSTKRKSQDRLESPKPMYTIPKEKIVEVNKANAKRQAEIHERLKNNIRSELMGKADSREKRKLMAAIEKIPPYRIWQAFEAYVALRENRESTAGETSEWFKIMENAVRLHLPEAGGRRRPQYTHIMSNAVGNVFDWANNPLSDFFGMTNVTYTNNRDTQALIEALEAELGHELAKDREGNLLTRIIDGRKFYLTPLSENQLRGVVEFDDMTPDEQAAVRAWLDKIKSDPRSTNDIMGGINTLNPITDTISARMARGITNLPGIGRIEYVKNEIYTAEHVIRHRRSGEGNTTREAIYNANKLLASRHIVTTTKSNWDAVTDNADYVFLAPLPETYRGLGNVDGFGFDGEYLIREKGAVVGTMDSIRFYDQLVERIVQEELGRSKTSGDIDKLAEAANTGAETFPGAQRILQRIKNEIGDAAKGYRVGGEAAIKLLREGKVAEILVPSELTLDDLLYVISDGKPYGLVEATDANVTAESDNILRDYTAEVQRTNPDSVVYRVHAPEQLAMEGRGRAKTAEIGEKALNTFIDSNAGIMKVLKAWSPTSRKWARMAKNEFVSGFGKLTELEAPEGSDAPSPADVIKEILRERQHISKLNAGRAISALEPHLLAFNKLARKRVSLRTEATAPKTRKAKRKELEYKVWNFIEYNTPIENDPDLLSVATDLKESWRELLIYDTQKIAELMEELETINEKLYVTDAAGKRVEWYGESFDGFEWDAENKAYTKDGKSYTIEEAHRAANKLYMPHYYRGKSPLQEYSALQKVLDTLNTLLAADTVDADALQQFGVQFDEGTSTYTHEPTGKTATTPYEMVRIVADYLATEDAALQGILNYYEDEGRVGYYGHLERTRETDDRFYTRDIALMAENRVRLWDRLAEVAVLGQQHPLLGDSPRMKTLIEQVLNFDKTPRETALRKVIEALNSGQEGMFQRMPQFATGVDVALDIMQHWLERDADGEKTGRYQEIDIGRMNLDDATLTELERIGLIEKAEVDAEVSDTSASTSGDRWKVVGDDINQRHATMARHIHEFYNTLAQRKKAVHSLVLGLGNWHTRDPLEMESAEFWKKINDTITVLTLNHGVAIQNLLEIPLISMMTGANPLFKGLKNMANKQYRDQMQQLSRGLSHARKFMADTSLADKYLGSPLTFFSKSDEFSRAAGLGIGLENAKEKIQQYAEATDPKKKAAIGRDMDAVRLNKEVIDSIPAEQLQRVLEAAEQHILNNEVDTVFSSEKGGELSPAERLAGTMLRSMFYVSDETFKQYDASSLPQFMVSRNPLIRVFMKYKSWMLQQNRLVYNQLRRAARETKKGNLRPLGDFIAATAMMGLGTGGLLWAYSILQGDEDDKAWQERLFKGLAAAQAFGIASVMFELAMYAEGNWYQMSNLLAKQAAGPTFSVAAQMIGPVFTGDFGRAGEEALRRLPIVSFTRRVGGWRLLEEATGTGEEE